MPRAKLTDYVLEYRTTGPDFDVAHFFESLVTPSWQQVAQRFKLPNPQRFVYWRTHKFLPWAVYLALRDIYGTPKFHQVPSVKRSRQPTRLPGWFNKYLTLSDLVPADAPACEHDFKPTKLGYLSCLRCGARGADVPVAADPIVEEAPRAPAGFSIPITWQGPDTLTLRIEVATIAATPPVVPHLTPQREKELVARIQQLEEELADMRAAQRVTVNGNANTKVELTKQDRHLLRTLAKTNPAEARALAHTLHR